MVSCCLWFPDIGGPCDRFHLTALNPEEWTALADWARQHRKEYPALAGLILRPLPAEVAPNEVSELSTECACVDWDGLVGLALDGFASLSLVISQGVAQAHTGLRFAVEDGEGC